MLSGFKKRRDFPMLLHITHAKAGSSWVEGILRTLLGRHVVPRSYHGLDFKMERGRALTLFLLREQFLSRPELAATKRFVLLRDLRDTLVSRYFSLRESHVLNDPAGALAQQRQHLRRLSPEEGLRHVLAGQGMVNTANIQRSWLGSGEPLFFYEDFIRQDEQRFCGLFLDALKLPVPEADLIKAVRANRFQTRFGRRLGEEDLRSHGRQGAPGDWRKHFTPALAAEFHERYGEVLLESGTEADPDWYRHV